MQIIHKYTLIALTLVINLYASNQALAHIMRAQHGTLNFANNGVYMVLSLPVSAFEGVDKNNDGKLSKLEFDQYQENLSLAVKKHIVLATQKGRLELQGLLLSPVKSHSAPNEPSNQIVIMGKFELAENTNDLQFKLGLFGQSSTEQAFKITAKNKVKGLEQVATLTPDENLMTLFKS